MTARGAEAYLYDAVRTPRGAGKPTGALHPIKPIELLACLYGALRERTGLDTSLVSDVVLGCVTAAGEQGANIAKISALYAGFGESVSGVTLNRFCASGLDAVSYAAMKVMSGMEDLVVAGGVESLSRVPMLSDGGAWFSDPDVARATRFVHMGISADLIATRGGFRREDCDAFALRSHTRAAHAREHGHFKRSLVPVREKEKDGKGQVVLDRDEWIRPGLTSDKLAALAPAFAEIGAAGGDRVALERYPELQRIEHVHTVGSSPGLVDGAALLLVGSREAGRALGLAPRARIVSMANASVEPVVMLTAPEPATQRALAKAGLSIADVDLFECNESFSATVLEWMRAVGADPDKVNVNGGAIAMGHPLGATGGILLATLLDELERRGLGVGLVTMCAGAGIGAAMVIERV